MLQSTRRVPAPSGRAHDLGSPRQLWSNRNDDLAHEWARLVHKDETLIVSDRNDGHWLAFVLDGSDQGVSLVVVPVVTVGSAKRSHAPSVGELRE